jgi:hypothetical protein
LRPSSLSAAQSAIVGPPSLDPLARVGCDLVVDAAQFVALGFSDPAGPSLSGERRRKFYNRPTQDGLRGHFVLRAIGKRFRKDRTAGCEKVVGIRFAGAVAICVGI